MALVTRWDGFCLPCGSEERPLVLTWSGRKGLRAWLAGEGWHDGELRLTCACCGGVDVVGWEDEPEQLLADEEPEEPEVPAHAPVQVVRVLDLDAPVASVHELVPAQRVVPAGSADVDALDLLGLVG